MVNVLYQAFFIVIAKYVSSVNIVIDLSPSPMQKQIYRRENRKSKVVVENRHTLNFSLSLSISIQFSLSVAKYFIGTIAIHNSYTNHPQISLSLTLSLHCLLALYLNQFVSCFPLIPYTPPVFFSLDCMLCCIVSIYGCIFSFSQPSLAPL